MNLWKKIEQGFKNKFQLQQNPKMYLKKTTT